MFCLFYMDKNPSLMLCRRLSLWFQESVNGRERVSPRAKGKLFQIVVSIQREERR